LFIAAPEKQYNIYLTRLNPNVWSCLGVSPLKFNHNIAG